MLSADRFILHQDTTAELIYLCFIVRDLPFPTPEPIIAHQTRCVANSHPDCPGVDAAHIKSVWCQIISHQMFNQKHAGILWYKIYKQHSERYMK